MLGQSLGSYTIERELGRGGMGAVYTAVHTLLGRRAAVKVLLPELSQNQELVQRFFNEARAATAIKHPSIVEIYDFGWAADGSAYIVMEFMEGEALGQRLQRLGRLPVAMAITIARQIGNALAAAHRAGIVHRDLKPDNVYLVADVEVVGGERVKLLDFGIAKLAVAGAVLRTTTGAIMGTPVYMSPEQCEGARAVDHRTDLYALGCILFEMIAGRPPFQQEGVGALIGAHLHVAPPTLRSVVPDAPADVEAIVARLLMKAPDDRYASADEVVAALTQAGVGASASAPMAVGAAWAVAAAASAVGPPSTGGPAMGTAPTPTTLSGASGAMARIPTDAPLAAPAGPPRRRGRWLAVGGALLVAGGAIAAVAVTSGGQHAAGPPTTTGLDAAAVAIADVDAAGPTKIAPDAAVTVAHAIDAGSPRAPATDATALDPAADALAAMRTALADHAWSALRAALDRVYDATRDGDARRGEADAMIAQARPLVVAEVERAIEADNAKHACADAARRARDTIERWGEAALPLKKLAARCKAKLEVPIDAGVEPPGDGLDRNAVLRIVRAQTGRLRPCGHDVPTRIGVTLEIDPAGQVTSVRVQGGTADDQACVAPILRAARFPPSTNGGSMTMPMVLPPKTVPPRPTRSTPAPTESRPSSSFRRR